MTVAVGLLFTLQGIPCLYHGTEQGLDGTVDEAGKADLTANESSRAALWGRPAAAGSGADFGHSRPRTFKAGAA